MCSSGALMTPQCYLRYLQWPPSSLPYQIYWSWAAHQGLHTHPQISSEMLSDTPRSARTLTCIHMSNSISPRGMAEEYFSLSTWGGWAQIRSMRQHQKPDETEDIYVWWWKEVMKLVKVCFLTCKVPYYTVKPHWIWVPMPWSGIQGSISVEWHQVWQVVHSSHSSKGATR